MIRRRDLLLSAGAAAAGLTGLAAGCKRSDAAEGAATTPSSFDSWGDVRAQFRLDPSWVHLSSMFIASHPEPVRAAIARHRDALDQDPAGHLIETNARALLEVIDEAADFFGASPDNVALTGSTTEALAVLYNGLHLASGDELLTEEGGYYSTWRSLDLKASREGLTRNTVRLFGDPAAPDEEVMVERLLGAVTPQTRVVALTWVHSDTGVKLPVRVLAEALAAHSRKVGREILLGVDGVHGFGVEDVTLGDLGCHFFAAGCHKWLYGPRGTGVLYAAQAKHWEHLSATVPPFGVRTTPGLEVTPGGFHAFEHRWALADAFRFQKAVGQARITARIRALCAQLKEGLAALEGVRVLTPRAPARSAGIVAFEVEGRSSASVVSHLRGRRFVVTQAPYGREAVRATPGYLNSPEEVDRLLEVMRALVQRPGR